MNRTLFLSTLLLISGYIFANFAESATIPDDIKGALCRNAHGQFAKSAESTNECHLRCLTRDGLDHLSFMPSGTKCGAPDSEGQRINVCIGGNCFTNNREALDFCKSISNSFIVGWEYGSCQVMCASAKKDEANFSPYNIKNGHPCKQNNLTGSCLNGKCQI